MKLKDYKLHSNYVDLFLQDGSMLRLWLDEWSGKIVFRHKINTISNVRHPGIRLGYDQHGNWYCMHNHYEHGRPEIEIEANFTKGQQLYIAERQSNFECLTIIQNGLNEILEGKAYNKITNNCQYFVNRVCFNENKSEAVNNWVGSITASLLLLLVGNAFLKSK
jgi:hypothetical protein